MHTIIHIRMASDSRETAAVELSSTIILLKYRKNLQGHDYMRKIGKLKRLETF